MADNKQLHVGKAIAVCLWVVLAFYAVQLVLSAILAGLIALGVSFDGINQSVLNASLASLVYTAALAAVIGFPWLIMRRTTSKKELGVHEPLSWRDLLLAPPAYILYMILTATVAYVVMQYVPAVDMTQAQDVLFGGLGRNYEFILAFLTLVIIAPIAEELLFRGYLFGALMRYVPIWAAMIVTSIIFGAVHGQWNVAIDTFVLSMVMCAVRLHTGTIWAPVIIHMIKNGIAFYLLFVNPTLIPGMLG